MEAKDAGSSRELSKDEGGASKGGGAESIASSLGSGPAGGGAEAKDSSNYGGDRDTTASDYQSNGDYDVKIILLGDSAVGKSKLVERYLMDDYNPTQLSTYALNTFRKRTTVDGKPCDVEFWDTAGQERFQKVHPAYYDGASACILVFDVTRKATYQHLDTWFSEMREAAGKIPCICVANKIDMNYKVTSKSFKFPEQHKLPFFFVSAADGTNVVKVFEQAVEEAVRHRNKVKEAVARGEFEDGAAGDLQFMAEVRDTLKYFEDKEGGP